MWNELREIYSGVAYSQDCFPLKWGVRCLGFSQSNFLQLVERVIVTILFTLFTL